MTRPVRVLVVDDSALMRQMISRFLKAAGMEVLATARDGVDGLEKALTLQPDVITLDVEMPNMNGLEMLRRLMAEKPTPVVMVSSVTQHQAPAAIEALMLGAVDIVAKPGGAISLNLADVENEIVTKVRTAASASVGGRRRSTPASRAAAPRAAGPKATGPRAAAPKAAARSVVADKDGLAAPTKPRKRRVAKKPPRGAAPAAADAPPSSRGGPVIIGSSTGGPGALSALFSELAADFPRPIVVIQHMPPGFTASLAARLDGLSALTVAEAVDGDTPTPGRAWIAPGGRHVVFDKRGRIRLSDAPPHLGVRPAVDLALESAVDVWDDDVIAVILTGMGVDGARGARKLKRVGGKVLAQDEETSVVYGMPRAVAELGLVDDVCPLPALADRLTRTAFRTI